MILVDNHNVYRCDNDNKLTIEEFEFFMTGFAKEYNGLMENNMVAKMLDTIYREKLIASRDVPKSEARFDIPEIVRKLKSVWVC